MKTTFGRQLQAQRQQRGLTLADAAHQTRIPVIWLRCLENEDFMGFGSFTYARSFLRAYSSFLGVDPILVDEHLQCAAVAERHKRGKTSRSPPYDIWGGKSSLIVNAKPSQARSAATTITVLSIFVLSCAGFLVHRTAQKWGQMEHKKSSRTAHGKSLNFDPFSSEASASMPNSHPFSVKRSLWRR